MRFSQALRQKKNSGRPVVIPDLKCISPKEGRLIEAGHVVDMAVALQQAGAPALSVVTEAKQFGGSLELLRQVVQAVNIPVLRKDFICTEAEIAQSKACGAAAVLLMYACLPAERLASLYHYAQSIGIEALVETHNAGELDLALALGAQLIGINNRDITQLECDDGDVRRTCALAAKAPDSVFLISESGLHTPQDVRTAIAAGADAALVGTAILRASSPPAYYQRLCRPVGIKICGLMRAADIDCCLSAGVDMVGCVCQYPLDVPWNVSAHTARQLRAHVSASCDFCLVTGGSTQQILDVADFVQPNFVQLHYRETMQQTAEIAAQLLKKGIRTIKALPLDAEEQKQQFGTAQLADIISQLERSAVYALLLDRRSHCNAAQQRVQYADWPAALFKQIRQMSSKPLLLGGGITACNVQQALIACSADYIDVMTGVEDAPGRKNEQKMQQLVRSLQKYRAIRPEKEQKGVQI